MLTGGRDNAVQQTAMAATKQEASKRLQAMLADGWELRNFLAQCVRQRYGNRAEELVELDLKPPARGPGRPPRRRSPRRRCPRPPPDADDVGLPVAQDVARRLQAL